MRLARILRHHQTQRGVSVFQSTSRVESRANAKANRASVNHALIDLCHLQQRLQSKPLALTNPTKTAAS